MHTCSLMLIKQVVINSNEFLLPLQISFIPNKLVTQILHFQMIYFIYST